MTAGVTDAFEKYAVVTPMRKQLRRAYQALQLGTHDWHGTRKPDGLESIIATGKVTSPHVPDDQARPLFGRGAPADYGTYFEAGGVAVPHERLNAPGQYTGPSGDPVPHVYSMGAVPLQARDFVIGKPMQRAAVVRAQQDLHLRPLSDTAFQYASIAHDGAPLRQLDAMLPIAQKALRKGG